MISKIDIEDMKVVKIIIDECMGSLEDIEKEVLELEMHPEDMGLYHNLEQRIHLLGRASSFYGLWDLKRLTYDMKSLLELIKNRKGAANTELVDCVLLCVDFLNTYIKRLCISLQEYDVSEENTLDYFEFATDLKEDQIFATLETTLNTYEKEKTEEDNIKKEGFGDAAGLDPLLSENFQAGLTQEVKEQFIVESTEHLEQLENDILIRLDSNENDREAINEIFRIIHSIKGGTGLYLATLAPENRLYECIKNFMELVHTYESLLSLIRDKQYSFENKFVNLSLKIIDYLKSFIRAVELDTMPSDVDAEILKQIDKEIQNIQDLPMTATPAATPVIHKEEGKAQDTNPKGSMSQSIRVQQEKIDNLMNMISELVITKNLFAHISAKLSMEYNLPEISKEVKKVGSYVNRISDELQNAVMSIRMVEIRTVFQKMPRVVRDIAQSTGKKIELVMEGENTEIDKTIIEIISDPLIHIIRNSADHGIESSEKRIEKAKSPIGRITLRAYNRNKYVYIEVEDDGKGIHPESIKKKAIEKGIISEMEAEKMSQSQLINLIFLPGFSMAEKITEVSGRGVGMDIVKSNITKIKGTISVESEVDKGTKMTIRLPLSLAVSHGLMVEAAGEDYIIPLDNIIETVKISKKSIHQFNGKFFTYLRNSVIGIEWLSSIFLGGRDIEQEEYNAVIISDGVENYGIVVDKLKNEQEFVIKALEGHLSAIPGISGSTLLGNGQVVLIVNPSELMELA